MADREKKPSTGAVEDRRRRAQELTHVSARVAASARAASDRRERPRTGITEGRSDRGRSGRVPDLAEYRKRLSAGGITHREGRAAIDEEPSKHLKSARNVHRYRFKQSVRQLDDAVTMASMQARMQTKNESMDIINQSSKQTSEKAIISKSVSNEMNE